MEPFNHAIVKDGEIITVCKWDGVTKWSYPDPAATVIPDPERKLAVGMLKDKAGKWFMPPPKPIEYEATKTPCETCQQLYFKPIPTTTPK